jgi:hypothetical protein
MRAPGRSSLAVLVLLVGACGPGDAPAPAVAAGADGGLRGPAGALAAIEDSAFGALVRDLSERGGYFDTDNLISNESSYLHVVGELEDRRVRGGAYLGVGPAQNFSYMTAIRPEMAFIVDIRRDNLFQHLWFKALFERSATRLDYLCLMVARSCGGSAEGLDVESLVRRVDAAPVVDTLDALIDAVADHAAAAGVPLTAEDREVIRSIHRRFARDGLDLRFNSHGRPPRPSYPTLRRLLLERDRRGRSMNYLADEEGYRYVAAMQRANRVIPVVGDLAGDWAVRAIGEEASRRELVVSAFYVSNIEFYLFEDDAFPRYIANLESLPVAQRSVLIRSYFNRFRPHPETVPGYGSTQLVQRIPALLAAWKEGRVRGYQALIAGVGGV